MRPGDSIIVPEKVIGGSKNWQAIISSAQLISSMALSAAVATTY